LLHAGTGPREASSLLADAASPGAGQQVCDFWCFATGNKGSDGLLRTFMSMHHSHDAIKKHIPAVGDVLVTSQSKPILTFLEDSGPGVHDTTVAACSHELYESILGIGPNDHHDSCTNNLHVALKALGYKLTDDVLNFYTPSPFNLWCVVPALWISATSLLSRVLMRCFRMNVPLRTTPAASFEDWWVGPDPRQKAGDFVVFRAEQDCVAVMSACPSSDISPLNGPTGKSHDIHYAVYNA
jgi:uncharacterized protein YcgI (DUF1989 family)